jgi:hypothetical protein
MVLHDLLEHDQKPTYPPPRPVTEIVYFVICRLCSYHEGNSPVGLQGQLGYSFTLLYVDCVRTTKETRLCAFRASWGIALLSYSFYTL